MDKRMETDLMTSAAHSGTILDEHALVSLLDLCRICDITPESVLEMVEEGLIEPQGREQVEWRFTWYEIRRIRVAVRLQQDLRVNLPGAALIVDLLEELEELRRGL